MVSEVPILYVTSVKSETCSPRELEVECRRGRIGRDGEHDAYIMFCAPLLDSLLGNDVARGKKDS